MTYTNIRDYLGFQVDLFIKLKVPFKYLRKKDKQVYIEFIICAIQGVDINTKDANELVRERVGFNYNIDVLQYKSKLFRKGWFKKDDYGNYILIDNFNYFVKQFKTKKIYNFTIELKDEDFNNTITDISKKKVINDKKESTRE